MKKKHTHHMKHGEMSACFEYPETYCNTVTKHDDLRFTHTVQPSLNKGHQEAFNLKQ